MTHERKPVLCIWHDGCLDGFGAAWALTYALGRDNVELYGATYGEAVPADELLVDREVYLVDFSFPADQLRHIAAVAKRVVVLDHHATAEEALSPLLADGTVEGCFEKDRSGALLTWHWFFPEAKPPKLIEHISDRDLWRFHLSGTEAVMASLGSYPKDLAMWSELMALDVAEMVEEGKALLRDHYRKIDDYLRYAVMPITVAGYTVMAANVPPAWASDAGNQLSKMGPFSVTFWIARDTIHVSLRSDKKTGISVREIAEIHGGGGHANAAGFRLDSWSSLRVAPLPGIVGIKAGVSAGVAEAKGGTMQTDAWPKALGPAPGEASLILTTQPPGRHETAARNQSKLRFAKAKTRLQLTLMGGALNVVSGVLFGLTALPEGLGVGSGVLLAASAGLIGVGSGIGASAYFRYRFRREHHDN